MMGEEELLLDCLQRLNASALDYMLTGSMASNYWGIPRSTHDLDFVLSMLPADADRFIGVFQPDFFLQPESVRSAFRPPYQFNALDERSALKVDFWMLRDDDFEQEMFRRRQQHSVFGVPAWITTAEDIILHKLHWNRISPSNRQLGDAAGVYSVQSGNLDLEYVNAWASKLHVEAELRNLIEGIIRPKST